MDRRKRFERFFSKTEGCWEWKGKRDRGYGRFTIGDGEVRSHRFAYELYVGSIPEGMSILHSCDNPPCVNPAHLRPGTHLENQRDKVERNRTPRGERSGSAKLKESQVIEIRRRLSAGEPKKAVAAEFGIHLHYVYRISAGEVWKNIAA